MRLSGVQSYIVLIKVYHWRASPLSLGHLQRADLFSCPNLSDSVRLGRPADMFSVTVRLRLGVFPADVPDPKNNIHELSPVVVSAHAVAADLLMPPPALPRAA
jgi:hypothetical protein